MDKRLPPGQTWIKEPVVYDINKNFTVPDEDNIYLYVLGAVENVLKIPYKEMKEADYLIEIKADFHCVTGWSVKDIVWKGVPSSYIIEKAKPSGNVKWVFLRCFDGYTAHFPYEYFKKPDTLIALYMNGEILPKDHGYPMRMVVPSLYAWKSAKYLYSIEFLEEEEKIGFWEMRGYHSVGDPWREERYA